MKKWISDMRLWIGFWLICLVSGFLFGECLRSYYGDENVCSIDSSIGTVTNTELPVAENE